MPDFVTYTCFGCGAVVEPLPGNFYCDDCVAKQVADEKKEREAFDAYHAFADSIARGER